MLEKRDRYAFQTKGTPDADGYQRMLCPAAARKVRCPNVPPSMAGDPSKPTIDTSSQASLPPVSQHRSTTFPPTVNEKTRQKHPAQTQRWQESYDRRTAVERSFARIKDADGENLGTKDSIKLVGRARIMLMRVFGYMKQNLRLIRAFRNGLPETPEPETPATRSERRTATVDQRLDELSVTSTSPT